MDCGIPFCHQGCPLGNLIPDWNDLVLSLGPLGACTPRITFPSLPGGSAAVAVLGINDDPVTIKSIEVSIIEKAFDEGWVTPSRHSSAPARPWRSSDRPGGPGRGRPVEPRGSFRDRVREVRSHRRLAALRHSRIQDGEEVLNRRLSLMEQEGVYFRANVNVGVDTFDRMKAEYDAIVLAGGAGLPRDLSVPGRDLEGIHFAMEYLTLSNKRVEGDRIAAADFISAKGKNVVIIGGGDTGADCLGTVHRQGALSVHQFELLPRPPDMRAADNPWPQWPNVSRVDGA